MPLKKLWKATAAGNRKAAYHSHLCASIDGDAWHVGAGVSMTAAAVQMAIEKLKSDNVKAVLREELYAKAMAEANRILPHSQLWQRLPGTDHRKRKHVLFEEKTGGSRGVDGI